MNSVRVRLLVLALAPLVVLTPFLLLVGMSRWTADYDKVLIANVDSDLRIAEQYLARLLTETGDDLSEVAGSVEFQNVLAHDEVNRALYFANKRQTLELDFLYFLPEDRVDPAADAWPVIASARDGEALAKIDLFEAQYLAEFPGGLEARARLPLIDTVAAVPTDRTVEDRGMVIHAAAPVRLGNEKGVLVGGVLLNRNLDFIDTINALVFLNAVTGGERQGTATLFLDDVRVSTNVRLFEDVRALGTRVSASVREAVLDNGETWLNRAFVVNDWYISGYLPLTDSFGKRVGMLYVGFLEAPFSNAKSAAFYWMLAAFAGVLAISAPVFLLLAKGIFAPLESMTRTMRQVKEGDYSARNGHTRAHDEIGQVAGHLDDLLNQVQERDAELRAWADELNHRVEERTRELREAKEKLEQTYQQLVMSEKLAVIGEITAGVAHEIINPVAVIQGNLDVIRDELGSEADKVHTEMQLLDQQVSRIRQIVGKLLKFSRPNEFSSHSGAIDIASAVEDCLVLVKHVLSGTDIEVVRDFEDDTPVRGDVGEFQQVVINLIINAAQAIDDHGTITLATRAERSQTGEEGVVLIVRDSGPGVPEEHLGAVFSPFFTTKVGVGTGLGLSISQSLIQRAGGFITVSNTPDGGAEFRVWMPVAGPEA